jgi:hypothetical protein
MGLLGHLGRPLTPKSGAKAIVFLGRDNGLPWNAALDVRIGSILLQKSKIEQPKNLAKVDLWTFLLLRRFSALLGRSVVDFG